MNIGTNGNYSLNSLWQKCMKIRQYIEFYLYSAGRFLHCNFLHSVFSIELRKIKWYNYI